MQSEQLRQRRREQKRLERERAKKASRRAQMCASDELDFLMPRLVTALFGRAVRMSRDETCAQRRPDRPAGKGTEQTDS